MIERRRGSVIARAAAGAVALVASVWSTATWAATSPCPDNEALRLDPGGVGPLPSSTGPADFGQVPEACPGWDLLERLRITLLVASGGPDYYGNLAVGSLLRVRFPLAQHTWMSVGVDVVTFRFVANAVVRSHAFDVGPPTLGLYRAVPTAGRGALAVYGRLLLPLDTARDNGVEVGAETGVSYWLPWRPRLTLQAGVAVPLPVDIIAGQVHAALRPGGLVEAVWRAGSAVSLTAGLSARVQVAPDPGLLALAGRGAARFALRHGLMLAIVAEAPFWGSDRTDLVASFFLGWTPGGPRRWPSPGPR
jgi:hypothetical protein